ncbi:MAG: uracil-DNA glycosylase family protein [Thermodesulfovibrionia bacterium]|nr:uracil-DNA glycosylase family protein [Thermodesulfovibrionia bacterium]
MDIIKTIEKYYKKSGIHSLKFTCPHKSECSLNSPNFTGPRSAFVPDQYTNSDPRIAFLSLDPGESDPDPKKRTPEAMRRQEQKDCIVEKLPKNLHWYETHYWTQQIYSAISSNDISLEKTHNYFCHLNSVKCCQNKPNNKEADNTLFINCRKYLLQELRIVAPQILITQGNQARNAVNEIFKSTDALYPNVYLITSPIKFLWVRTYHPSSRGYYHTQKKDLDNIISVLKKNITRIAPKRWR